MNKKKAQELLKFYIKLFHELTFNIENEFSHIYSYNERKVYFMKTYQKKVFNLRNAFYIDYYTHEEFKEAYHEYMDREQDYILFVNLNFSSVDQRKFSKKWYQKNISKRKISNAPKVNFTAFWYQVVLWEVYTRHSVAYWKSRDIGLSFTIIAGETMSLLHGGSQEVIFLSKTEKDVDITSDRTQSNMGRARGGIEDSIIYTLRELNDKHLMLYNKEGGGIKGANIEGGGRQGRFGRGFDDEAGIQKKIKDVVEAIKMATTTTIFAGTLKVGTDAGFREIINAGHRVSREQLRGLFDKFVELSREGVGYTEAWDQIFEEFDKTVPQGLHLSFTNTYEDHPLKNGNCDYFIIESNILLNDKVIIDNELKADLEAGSPARSFYDLTSEHHEELELDHFEKCQVFMGFDPGSVKNAAMVPIIQDHYGFTWVLPAEIYTDGTMDQWLDYLISKYGRFHVFPEESVLAYSKAGAGWMAKIRRRKLEYSVVRNRHITDQLRVVNELFRRERVNPRTGKKEFDFKCSNKNKWFTMSYIHGAKYRDALQKKMSHPSEAMIAGLFKLNEYVLEEAEQEWGAA